MPLSDVLQRHWKKLAILGLVVAIGICVAIGLAVTNDVEQPEDEQLPEGGTAGAQKGGPGGSHGVTPVIGGVRVPHELRDFAKEKAMPNFFEREKDPVTGELFPPDSYYHSGVPVFLQNKNSGGQLMKLCLEDIIPEGSELVSGQTFYDYYSNPQSRTGTTRHVVEGDCVLGTCDVVPEGTPCSYFTIISDPYERAVSTYIACLSKSDKCGTLTEWANNDGDYFLRQILQNQATCGKEPKANVSVSMKGIEDQALNMASDGLQQWFSVVCTTADIEACFRILEEVYNLPFYKKCGGSNLVALKERISKSPPPSEEVMEKLMSQVNLADPKVNVPSDYHELTAMLRKQLSEDKTVNMHADSSLFFQTQKIFEVEKTQEETHRG